ncbi:MAG: flagellar basal body P-ring formation chaperone FlgA [Phycisphaerales bacterium]
MNIRILAAFLSVLASTSLALAQTTVRLRPAATREPDHAIKLSDVATISGDTTSSLASIVLVEADAASHPKAIDVAFVRDALKKANVNLGEVLLSGVPCSVSSPTDVDPPEKDAAPVAESAQSTPILAAAAVAPDVRSAIASKLAEIYRVSPDRLRLTFERSAEELLNTDTRGRKVAVQPAAAGKRVPVQVRIYDNDTLERSGTVRVGIEVLREVLVAAGPIARAAKLDADVVTTDSRWLPPDFEPAVYDETIGAVAQSRIDAGAIIEARMVKTPSVVDKGDICAIDCLSGGVAVQGQGRAMEAARQGQVVRFQSVHSKKTFLAKVSGPGRAVMTIGTRPAGEEESKP